MYSGTIYSGDQIKEDEMCKAHGTHVEKREVKRPLGRLKHRWEDNIKCILARWDDKVWTGLFWTRTGTSGGLL